MRVLLLVIEWEGLGIGDWAWGDEGDEGDEGDKQNFLLLTPNS
jgi:hypothetical protein